LCWAFAGGADSATFCSYAGFVAFIAVLSSPSPRMTAMGVLTATSAVPSGTRIFPSVPWSAASTSIVALSVSISAITSPDLIVSPSFLSHLARLPFSIVGDSAGMRTSVGMGRYCFPDNKLAINVSVKLRYVRFGVMGGELRRLVDHITHFAVYFLERVLAGEFLLQDSLACHVNRIVVSADLVDLFTRAIFGRGRHRRPGIAGGLHFNM